LEDLHKMISDEKEPWKDYKTYRSGLIRRDCTATRTAFALKLEKAGTWESYCSSFRVEGGNGGY